MQNKELKEILSKLEELPIVKSISNVSGISLNDSNHVYIKINKSLESDPEDLSKLYQIISEQNYFDCTIKFE